jgi:hypothetical protein
MVGVTNRRRAAGTAVCALAVSVAALWSCAPNRFVPVPEPVAVRAGQIERLPLFESLAPAPESNAKRVDRLYTLFEQAGCSEGLVKELPGGSPTPNVLCVLQGRTPWTIVVGAHVDKAPDGSGAADNWGSIALLPTLYRSLRTEPREHTFVFAGFGHAQLRQKGSRGFLRRMGPEQREQILAMVNLKGLGLSSTAFWSGQSDRNLRQDLFAVAKALDLPLREVRFFQNVTTDSRSFRMWGIPAITIHSFDSKNARILAQPHYDGGPVNIDVDAYYDSARMLAFYLAYLDDTMRIRREKALEEDSSS